MHNGTPYGHLSLNNRPITDAQLSMLTCIDMPTVISLMAELEASCVFSRTRSGVVYSRRMVDDAKRSAQARKFGKMGGDKDLNHIATVPLEERGKRFNRKDNPKKVAAVWEACGGCCSICAVEMDFNHRNLPNSFEIDHIIPISQSAGLQSAGMAWNDLENLRGVCKRCNLAEAKRLGRERRLQSEGHPAADPAADPAANPSANTQILEDRYQSSETEKKKEEGSKGEGCVSSNSVVLFPVAASPSAPPPSTPATAHGSRLPQGWTLPQSWGEWAMEAQNLSVDQVRREADNFHDYWVAKAGAAGRKADWLATWRTWVRKSQNFTHGGNTNGRHHQSQRQPERNGFAVINRALEERDGRSFDFGDTGNSGW
jgi:5-methylcytosine-specific restriction endonuclease McrA